MKRVVYLIQKEFRQIFRDKPMLGIIFLVPVIQLLILSFAVTTEVKNLTLMAVDLDNSATSREIIQSFSHTREFRLVAVENRQDEIKEKMQSWQVQVALVIPPNFESDLRRGLKPQLQIVADGVDGNTAGIAVGYAQRILALKAPQLAAELIPVLKTNPGIGVIMEERMWYNPELDSKQYMIPGIVVLLLTILPMMLSSMGLVKEKEIGTLEQLMVTPLKKQQLLIGKIIPHLILSYIELFIVTLVAVTVFKIQMNGSYLLLGGLALLYLFTTIGLGIFISTVTQSQQQAMFFSWFAMVFMILMSGFFIPIPNMPEILQKLTYLNPMRYFMSILRDIFQKGSGVTYLLKDIVPMTVFGLFIFSMGILNFRKRIN
ncbi:MAG: ABC transporter permease [Calditrichia bacterium]